MGSKQDPADDCHYMQMPVWAEVKRRWGGFESRKVELALPEGPRALYLYVKKVPGVGRLAYAPMWPHVFRPGSWPMVREAIEKVANDCFAVRFEPAVDKDVFSEKLLEVLGLEAPGGHVQYLSTIHVDIGRPLEEVMAAFPKNTRYEIKTAAGRHGIVCSSLPVDEEGIELLSGIVGATKARKGFYLRQDAYLRDYWEAFGKTGEGALYAARKGEDVLAMAYVIINGRTAFYKDAGSLLGKEYQQMAAPVLLQWHIIQDLHAKGVTDYDLCGALANGVADPSDPLWGVYNFKRKFNRELTQYPGFIDLPLRALQYGIWRKGERVITQGYRKLKGDIWY